MPRIRTIKPEFSQSETIGKLSREARLLFIQLWTFVDDHGRARGSSRLIAASLYPYDDDVLPMIDGWFYELEANNCARRYTIDGDTYLEIQNWKKHQRIDNAGKSRIPEFRGISPQVSANGGNPPLYLGPSTLDLVPSTLDPAAKNQEPVSLKKNDVKNGKEGKKTKPHHLSKTKTGGRLWCDIGTSEWRQYADDYRKAHSGVDPKLDWNGAGSWFNLAGEIAPPKLNGMHQASAK